jgi:hypothetical protein
LDDEGCRGHEEDQDPLPGAERLVKKKEREQPIWTVIVLLMAALSAQR